MKPPYAHFPDLDGSEIRQVKKLESNILNAERGLIVICALWIIWLWGVEPFLQMYGTHHVAIGGF